MCKSEEYIFVLISDNIALGATDNVDDAIHIAKSMVKHANKMQGDKKLPKKQWNVTEHKDTYKVSHPNIGFSVCIHHTMLRRFKGH